MPWLIGRMGSAIRLILLRFHNGYNAARAFCVISFALLLSGVVSNRLQGTAKLQRLQQLVMIHRLDFRLYKL